MEENKKTEFIDISPNPGNKASSVSSSTPVQGQNVVKRVIANPNGTPQGNVVVKKIITKPMNPGEKQRVVVKRIISKPGTLVNPTNPNNVVKRVIVQPGQKPNTIPQGQVKKVIVQGGQVQNTKVVTTPNVSNTQASSVQQPVVNKTTVQAPASTVQTVSNQQQINNTPAPVTQQPVQQKAQVDEPILPTNENESAIPTLNFLDSNSNSVQKQEVTQSEPQANEKVEEPKETIEFLNINDENDYYNQTPNMGVEQNNYNVSPQVQVDNNNYPNNNFDNNQNYPNMQNNQNYSNVQNNQNYSNTQNVQTQSVPKKIPGKINSGFSLFNREVTNVEMYEQFIENNYFKISKNPFNFAAFLFGPVYLWYRKILVLGVIFALLLYVGQMASIKFLDHSDQYYTIYRYLIMFGPWALTGLLFNKLYMFRVKRKTAILKQKYGAQYDAYDMGRLCSKKGGTDFSFILVGFLLTFGILYGTNYLTTQFMNFDLFEYVGIDLSKYDPRNFDFNEWLNGTSKEENEVVITIVDDNNSNNIISMKVDNTITINDNVEIEIPTAFSPGTNQKLFLSNYVYGGEKQECEFKLFTVTNYTTSTELINEFVTKYSSQKQEVPFDELKWSYVQYNGENKAEAKYTYATDINGKVYVYTFDLDSTSKNCEKYRTDILKSIKSKK